MATRYQQEQFRSDDFLRSLASTKPLIWLHRPRWLHVKNTTGVPCSCCGSRHALRVTDERYLDLLISRHTGIRKLRSEVEDKDAWDRLAHEQAERINIPFRCHEKQKQSIEAHPKILLVTGGVGGGKSEVGVAKVIDKWMEHGGKGCQIWWVAPELKHLEIAFNKFFVGDFSSGRHQPPALPPQVVVRHPSKPTERDLTAPLIDGTTIRFWHAGNEGQFKGLQPSLVVGDEFAEVNNDGVVGQLMERVMRSGGELVFPTTPKVPSSVKQIYDDGVELKHWDGSFASKVWTHFTSYDNPWLPDKWIDDHIATNMRGDDTRIRREIYGEWIGDGLQLWRLFDPKRHIFRGLKDVEDIGLVNVTGQALGRFFRNEHITEAGGMDFNLNPMSLERAQVGCPPGLDEKDPKNWVVAFVDEVVEPANIYQFADRLKKDHGLKGLHIACDPSGAQRSSYQASHGVKESSTLALELERQGFPCKPCNRTAKGSPKQPPVKDRINIAHKLMGDRVKIGSTELPRFIVSDRCASLIKSLESQESDDEGKPAKEPNTASDRLAGPTDAATYLTWAVFGRKEYRPNKVRWS
jgi:hypothetical protein